MAERLQKFLAQAGVASRRHAEEIITQGRVRVNDVVVRTLGTKVTPGEDRVVVDGKEVVVAQAHQYFILYKPEGVLTTLKDPQGRPDISQFTSQLPGRVYPVGRLDFDAEGALLLTDDGQLALRLTHPRFEVPRTYLAKVKGAPTEQTLDQLRGGVRLEDGPAQPRSVAVFDKAERNTWLAIVVAEGRPHIIKRLCAAVGHPVVRLFRPEHGGISVTRMRAGDVRPLSPEEVVRVDQVSRGEVQPTAVLRLPARRHAPPEAHASHSPPHRRSH